jgi:hypothetical protein
MKLARSLFVTALACATGADAQTVRADNPPVWGTSVEVVEELRIGRLDGPPEYAFSVVGDLALDAHGGVYVYDQLDTAIRQFDTRGRFVRQVGRGGSGPGELRRVKGLAVTDDGDLAVWDLGNSRIAVFDSSGTYLRAHRILGGIDEPNAFAVDTSGTFHVKAMLGARGAAPTVAGRARSFASRLLDNGSVSCHWSASIHRFNH